MESVVEIPGHLSPRINFLTNSQEIGLQEYDTRARKKWRGKGGLYSPERI